MRRVPNRAALGAAAAALAIFAVTVTYAGAPRAAKPTVALPVTTTPPRATTTTARRHGPITIAVVGDSIAGTIVWGLDEIMKGTQNHLVSTAYPACGVASGAVIDPKGKVYPWSPTCAKNVPKVHEEMIAQWHPDVVFWSSSWEVSNRLDLRTHTVLRWGTAAAERALLASIDAAARRLTAGGAHLVLLTVAPPGPNAAQPAGDPGLAEVQYNALLRRYAAAHAGNISVLDIMPFVCPGGPPCPANVRGVNLRPDSIHYTHETAPIVARWLLPRLLAAAPGRP
ncbi:MAG: putative O-acetyltransferase [Actinomycetia bacterium]|nr:putative O-acetyltransferase [Actinomycetes bacterium]